MEYFILEQDQRVADAVLPTNVEIPRRAFKRLEAEEQDDLAIQYYVKDNPQIAYIDFIERPVPLVTDAVKQIMEKYDPKLFLKPVVLADPKRMRQELYWLVLPKMLDCLSKKSEFNKNGTLKRLVIDEEKVGGTMIFRIHGTLEEQIIINLYVAESMLRRGFTGFWLKRVEIEEAI
ncbi:MAG TPA: DUF1629 domain-containing protein [Bacillota bacterium]|nr:DUF1629 domain-containing protein [Bacillota bacterium]